MIYKKYGQTFKQLREQQGIPLTDFSEIGISKSALSKFERGESMMAFDKVTLALQQLDITLEEFELFLNGMSFTESDALLKEIEQAKLCRDIPKLKEIYRLALGKNLIPIYLSAKACYSKLSSEEIDFLDTYFYDLTIPGSKELRIFCLVMEKLQTHSVLQIIDFFSEDRHNILHTPPLKTYFLDACCSAVLILTQKRLKNYARHILGHINSFLDSEPYNLNLTFYRVLFPLLKGIWQYKFENKTSGKALVQSSFNILRKTASPEIVSYYANLCLSFNLRLSLI